MEAQKTREEITRIDKAKQPIIGSMWDYLFGEHPMLIALKQMGEVDNSGICPVIDMRKKK